MEAGGHGNGSLFAYNYALLFKWQCQFLHNPNALWARVIKGYHGVRLAEDEF